MNLFDLFVKIDLKDNASEGIKRLTESLGNGLKTAAKIGTAAVAAVGTGVAALTKEMVDQFAEYEQLVGGVETLFKDSADTVKQYASEAYRSAGLSANEYMSTVTGFSASLLQSLGRGAQTDLDALKENLDEQYDATKKSWQDRIALAKKLKQNNVAELKTQMDAELKALKKGNEQKLAEAETANNKSVVTAKTQALAADLANQAVIDMADNAAKMGTSMEMIQNAYAGFAKQNYTMLDNLKLGYGGTQSEMQRLIKDAAALDSSIDANSMSFANIVKAINVVQTEMGITGTTAKEGTETISGSIATMKAAWANLVTSVGAGSKDIGKSIKALTDSVKNVVKNIEPVIRRSFDGILDLANSLLPMLFESLPGYVSEFLPKLINVSVNILESIAVSLEKNAKIIGDSAAKVILFVAKNLPQNIKSIVSAIKNAIKVFAETILANKDEIINAVVDVVQFLLTEFYNAIPHILQIGIDLLTSLANGIDNALPSLLDTIFDVIVKIVEVLTKPENLQGILKAGLKIITTLARSFAKNIDQIVNAALMIIEGLVEFLVDPENLELIGKAAIEIFGAFLYGLGKATIVLADKIYEWTSNLLDTLFGADWVEVASDFLFGFLDGLEKVFPGFADQVEGLFKGFFNGLFKSPFGLFPDVDTDRVSILSKSGKVSIQTPEEEALAQAELDALHNKGSFLHPSVGSKWKHSGVTINQYISSTSSTAADIAEEASYKMKQEVLGLG